MIRFLRRGVHLGSLLILLALWLPVLLVLLLIFIDTDEYQKVLVDEFNSRTGWVLRVGSDPQWAWSDQLALRFKDVQVFAEPTETQALMSTRTLSIDIDLLSIIKGDLRVSDIDLENLRIDVGRLTRQPAYSPQLPLPDFDRIEIRQLQLVDLPLTDGPASVNINQLRLSQRDGSHRFYLQAGWSDEDLIVTGNIEQIIGGAARGLVLQARLGAIANFQAHGEVSNLLQLAGFDLTVDARLQAIPASISQKFGGGTGLLDNLWFSGALSGSPQNWILSAADIRIDNGLLELGAKGQVNGTMQDFSPDLQLVGRFKNVDKSRLLKLPGWLRGDVRFKAGLIGSNTGLALSNLTAWYRDQQQQMQLTGDVFFTDGNWNPDLDLQMRGKSLALLVPPSSWTTWLNHPFSGTARVEGNTDELQLSALTLKMLVDDLEFAAAGRISRLFSDPRAVISISASGQLNPDRQLMPEFLLNLIPDELLELAGTASLDTGAATLLQIDRIQIKSKNAKVDFAGTVTADGELDLVADYVGELMETETAILPPLLQGLDHFSGKFRLRGRNSSLQITDISLLAQGTHQQLQASGTIQSLTAKPEFKGYVRWNIESLEESTQFARLAAVPGDPALQMGGKVSYSQHGFEVADIQIQLGRTRFSGDLQLSKNQSQFLEARLTATELYWQELFAPAEESLQYYFSNVPFSPWWQTANLQIALDLSVDRLFYNERLLKNVRAGLTSDRNGFSLRTNDMTLDAGTLRLEMQRRGALQEMTTRMRLLGHNLSATLLNPGATASSLIQDGELDINVEIAGPGNSWHEVLVAGEGSMLLELQRSHINNQVLKLLGEDILNQVLRVINPFSDPEKTMELECAVVHFQVKDGKAQAPRGIAVQTTAMRFIGDGEVDLGDESLQIRLIPSAREGLGISPSTLFNIVRLGGTLLNPAIEADPLEVFKSGAKIGAAFYSGGLTVLLQGLFNRFSDSDNFCQQARHIDTTPPLLPENINRSLDSRR